MKTIDENVIQNYIYELLNINSKKTNNKLAINTIYGIVQVLKNGFQLALNLKFITNNPTLNIILPKSVEKDVKALTFNKRRTKEN